MFMLGVGLAFFGIAVVFLSTLYLSSSLRGWVGIAVGTVMIAGGYILMLAAI